MARVPLVTLKFFSSINTQATDGLLAGVKAMGFSLGKIRKVPQSLAGIAELVAQKAHTAHRKERANVREYTAGESGTRTLDLGLMRAAGNKAVRVNSTTCRAAPVTIGTTVHNEAAPSHAKLTQGSCASMPRGGASQPATNPMWTEDSSTSAQKCQEPHQDRAPHPPSHPAFRGQFR